MLHFWNILNIFCWCDEGRKEKSFLFVNSCFDKKTSLWKKIHLNSKKRTGMAELVFRLTSETVDPI